MKVTAADLETLIKQWQSAFEISNGRTAPAVVWEKGWFLIKDGFDYIMTKFPKSPGRTQKPVTMPHSHSLKSIECTACDGTGYYLYGLRTLSCATCDGTGRISSLIEDDRRKIQ